MRSHRKYGIVAGVLAIVLAPTLETSLQQGFYLQFKTHAPGIAPDDADE